MSTKKNKKTIIAIDGPVASGKSSVGEQVAARAGCKFLDTGLMYRAVAWLSGELGVETSDARGLKDLAADMEVTISGSKILVDGEDVSALLRRKTVEARSSIVATVPDVRKTLVAKQQAMAAGGGIVMVGRDIGTVVLPDAPLKIYLDAPISERARRRHQELVARNPKILEQDVFRDLEERDKIDSERKASPLQPADDAIVIDTGALSLDNVVEIVLDLIPDES
ncbi:(d)CMP kinase [Dehalococcoidia bacterium]|nr:(d)CMP kinase [Dehalococcoidia bacterium]